MTWHDKVHRVIYNAASAEYHRVNDGKKSHHPYSVPCWVDDLVEALGDEDEEKCKSIMMFHTQF